MTDAALEKAIEDAWTGRDAVNGSTKGPIRDAVNAALDALDTGKMRVAEKKKAPAPSSSSKV